MPLSSLQAAILRLLAAHRDPESYLAGSTLLNRSGARISGDIDIFHDREERVAHAARDNAAVLEAAGMHVVWQRREPAFYQAMISQSGETTRLEWVVDSDFRFFPVQTDPDFGYVLHPVDLATNKVMAAAGRREPRDIVDVVAIHDEILSLGAVVWAAVEKAPGFTPEGLLNEIRRNACYTVADFQRIDSLPAIDANDVMRRLRAALEQAETFVARMPSDLAGRLFLHGGRIVQPDPAQIDSYQTHVGRRKGHWPSSPDIGSAMLEHYAGRSRLEK